VRRPGRLQLLFLAILIPCAALGALGVRSVVLDATRTEQRFREQAENALDTAAAAVEAAARGLPGQAPGALAFVATAGGEIVEPAEPAASRPATRADDGTVADLLLSVLTEVDRLERQGEADRAAARLREFLQAEPPAELAGAALTALGAIEKKRGRLDDAKEAWRAIVSRHPGVRDPRGLKRSFAARLALLDAGAGEAGEIEALARDVVEDDRDPARTATGALKRELRDRLAASGVPSWFDARDRELENERRLRAVFAGGLGEWIVAGGRGVRTAVASGATRAAADAGSGPERVVVAVRDGPAGRVQGGLAPLAAVIDAALARPEVRALEAVGFKVGVAAGAPAGPARPRSLGDELGGVTLALVGSDLEAFRAQERSRVVGAVLLAAFGVLVAVLAAFATTRAVTRELLAVRDRENFVAAVTHELKAPLASIRLLAEVLARGGVEEPKVREFADRAIGECDRLSRLVGAVLELAKLERGPDALLKLETVDAGVLARAVMRTFEPVAAKNGFSVAVRVADPGLVVTGDRDALSGALLNLLDNAMKYADAPGEIELEVAAAGPRHAAFAVLDRGRGVPASEARRIFDPFVRLGSEMTRDRPGVGLGLALVGRIAAAHGGRAACEARPGGGSRFSVVVPLARAST
jgi:signal transduction histidine kinase